MGGVCSRKKGNQVNENGVPIGVKRRYIKNGSSKWLLGTPYYRIAAGLQPETGSCPSLLELCIHKLRQDIDKCSSFSVLPRDISQLIFDDLVCSQSLTDASLEAFRDCALQDIYLGDYPGVDNSWMDVISSQGSSLLSVDLSGSDVTDSGLALLKCCSSLQALSLNFCDHISEHGLQHIAGLLDLTSLSFRSSYAVTAEGMRALSGLGNLKELDLERCSGVHGGFVHLKGLKKLETLNARYCKCITDSDLKALSEVKSLKELQVSCSSITDVGVAYLKGLHNLILLNLEGCRVTAACLDSISALVALQYLNLSRCGLSDRGCDKLSKLIDLKVLNLGFNDITDVCLSYLKGLSNLETLNFDSCGIGDEGLANLSGLIRLKNLELSDTEVGSTGLRYISGLKNLESINLSFTLITDAGLKKLSGITSLKSLNLDARQITDDGLAALTSLTGLAHLDLFGARISDSGTQFLRSFKNLQSLEICGGGLTDAGIKNIKDLSSLTLLNLSQNRNLTNLALEMLSDTVYGSLEHPKIPFSEGVNLRAGVNKISLLSIAVGFPNVGPHFEMLNAGILGPVSLSGLNEGRRDLTWQKWSYKLGLRGESLDLHSLSGVFNVQWVEEKFVAQKQLLTWYKTMFNAPPDNAPLALDMGDMGKGQVWINGQNIGQYWPSYTAKGSCGNCNYAFIK